MKRIFNFYFLLSVMLLLECSNDNSNEIIYNLPNNYTGVVVIIFEGKIKKEKSNFDIPENGILYSPYLRNKGVFKEKYFYVDENKKPLIEIENYAYKQYHNDLKKGQSYILDQYDGVFCLKSKEEDLNQDSIYSTKNMKMIKWIYFTVGKSENQSYELRKKANKIIDSLQKIR
ncbi:hypothetical protein JSO59_002415 [Riemerella anatipestifer]|uniref:hypothetical protein n=1 Tax=Riemerella anatipestifer TaxID=34085 RepID=UPI0030BF0701